MSTTTEKQATGFVMTSEVGKFDYAPNSWVAQVFQDTRRVFVCNGCESREHAEQIARDICVRYGLVERPTI